MKKNNNPFPIHLLSRFFLRIVAKKERKTFVNKTGIERFNGGIKRYYIVHIDQMLAMADTVIVV